ncbi:MAG: putative circadian clock protein KaiC [Pedosphaera sp.]|nr:putative circadian clock protein KaiC [Pedosphaera sp.]
MAHTPRRGGLIKSVTGIPGFDESTGGGLPQNRTTLVMGGPGSGKTVFALQSLVTGALKGEAGILVTFQETPRQIVENAATFGWNLADLEKDKLVILDARVRPNAFNSIELYLSGMLAGIQVVAKEMNAKRVVFDSIDALLSLLSDRTTERQEIARLRDWLSESGLTTVITAQVENNDPFISQRHGALQFMADCVVLLDYQASSHTATRSLRVLKYRGSGFVESELPMTIGSAGLHIECVESQETIRSGFKLSGKSGIEHEIELARSKFKARIDSLSRKLEMKQSELAFLKAKAAQKDNASTRKRRTSNSRKPAATRKSLLELPSTVSSHKD